MIGLCLLSALSGVSGCQRHPRLLPPAATYRDVENRFQHGDLIVAAQESEAAFVALSEGSPEWAWRFRVLEAEILVWRGLSTDALPLLRAQLPPDLANSDVGVRREIILGLAQCSLQEFDEAEQHFGEAERLAGLHQPELMGEVLLGRGNLLFARGDLRSAENAYLQALRFARDNKQSFLTLKSLGSLGWVTMEEERYDESIDWDTDALSLGRSLNARIAIEKVLGNEGWNYYKMGDLDNALSLSQQAKLDAQQLGGSKDEMLWIRNIGAIEDLTARLFRGRARLPGGLAAGKTNGQQSGGCGLSV